MGLEVVWAAQRLEGVC